MSMFRFRKRGNDPETIGFASQEVDGNDPETIELASQEVDDAKDEEKEGHLSSASKGELRIALLGDWKSEMSTVRNIILDRVEPESNRNECKKFQGKVSERWVTIVETPRQWMEKLASSWFLSRGIQKIQPQIEDCGSLLFPGPHVFLLVVPSEITEEKKILKAVEKVLGQNIMSYTMVLQKHEINSYRLSSDNKKLQTLLKKCGNRSHVFNSDRKDRTQVTELLGKIDEIVAKNGGYYYCNEIYRADTRSLITKRENELIERNLEEKRNMTENLRVRLEALKLEYEEELKRRESVLRERYEKEKRCKLEELKKKHREEEMMKMEELKKRFEEKHRVQIEELKLKYEEEQRDRERTIREEYDELQRKREKKLKERADKERRESVRVLSQKYEEENRNKEREMKDRKEEELREREKELKKMYDADFKDKERKLRERFDTKVKETRKNLREAYEKEQRERERELREIHDKEMIRRERELREKYEEEESKRMIWRNEEEQRRSVNVMKPETVVQPIKTEIKAMEKSVEEQWKLPRELRIAEEALQSDEIQGSEEELKGNPEVLSVPVRRRNSMIEDPPNMSEGEIAEKQRKDRRAETLNQGGDTDDKPEGAKPDNW